MHFFSKIKLCRLHQEEWILYSYFLFDIDSSRNTYSIMDIGYQLMYNEFVRMTEVITEADF